MGAVTLTGCLYLVVPTRLRSAFWVWSYALPVGVEFLFPSRPTRGFSFLRPRTGDINAGNLHNSARAGEPLQGGTLPPIVLA